MPFDANGNFTRNMNWQDDAANDIPILASRHDDEDDNFANGFNNTVCRDGRAAMTGALKMGGYKVTGMADGTASTDAVTKSQLDAQNTSLTAAINAAISTMLSTQFPVGSLYMGTQSSCPMANLMPGTTWTLVSSGKALWTGTGSNGNTTIAAGLPNITGKCTPWIYNMTLAVKNTSGAFKVTESTVRTGNNNDITTRTITGSNNIDFAASRSNSIYGNSSTVQPPAYVVNVWRRTA